MFKLQTCDGSTLCLSETIIHNHVAKKNSAKHDSKLVRITDRSCVLRCNMLRFTTQEMLY